MGVLRSLLCRGLGGGRGEATSLRHPAGALSVRRTRPQSVTLKGSRYGGVPASPRSLPSWRFSCLSRCYSCMHDYYAHVHRLGQELNREGERAAYYVAESRDQVGAAARIKRAAATSSGALRPCQSATTPPTSAPRPAAPRPKSRNTETTRPSSLSGVNAWRADPTATLARDEPAPRNTKRIPTTIAFGATATPAHARPWTR